MSEANAAEIVDALDVGGQEIGSRGGELDKFRPHADFDLGPCRQAVVTAIERNGMAVDPRLPLDRAAIDAALADRKAFIGAAGDQVDAVVAEVDALIARYPDAAKYTPGAIL